MKYRRPASRAPGVSSVGTICAATLSTSAPCSAEKNPSLPGLPDLATFWACSCAARIAGHCEASQAEPSPVAEPAKNDRREAPCFLGIFLQPRPKTLSLDIYGVKARRAPPTP